MSVIGLYGKIPAQGDFVRVNASDPAALALIQWLADGVDVVQRAGAQLTSDTVFFLYRSQAARSVCVGAFAPSHDSVGRTFPMAVFALMDAAQLAGRFAEVPVAAVNFLAQAADLIARSPHLNASQLSDAVRMLQAPTPADFASATDTCRRTLAGTLGADMQRRLFGDLSQGRQYYAFRTFAEACAQVRGREPQKPGVTLQCPIASDVDLFAWLEATRRSLRWTEAPPGFFWTEGQAPQLLIALGPAPASVMLYLTGGGSSSAKLWPLWTDRADSIETAARAIPAAQRQALDDPHASLESLVASLADM